MTSFLLRYATPLIAGLFAVSAVSGVALFFHWAPRTFHEMHEVLSMVLLVPFVLHIWKNWHSVIGYLKRRAATVVAIVSVLVAVPFAAAGLSGEGGRGGNPALRAIPLMTQARVADLAPVLKTTPDALVAALKKQGYKVDSAEQTLNAIAAASGKPARQALFSVMPQR